MKNIRYQIINTRYKLIVEAVTSNLDDSILNTIDTTIEESIQESVYYQVYSSILDSLCVTFNK